MCTTWPVRLQRSDEKSDRNDHDHSDDGSDVEHVVAFLLGGDPVQEISCIANEYWGSDGFLIRNGYNLIDEEEQVGMRISEGDVIELIPDPISL